MINTILRVIDIILGTVGLLLIIKTLMVVFRVSAQHPVLRLLTAITEPLITGVKQALGIPAYPSLYVSSPAQLESLLNPNQALTVWILSSRWSQYGYYAASWSGWWGWQL